MSDSRVKSSDSYKSQIDPPASCDTHYSPDESTVCVHYSDSYSRYSPVTKLLESLAGNEPQPSKSLQTLHLRCLVTSVKEAGKCQLTLSNTGIIVGPYRN